MKGISKTIENKTKNNNNKKGFLGMLLVSLGVSLLGNILTGTGMLRAGYGNKEGKRILRAGYGSSIKKNFLIPLHPLTNFEIQKYYQNEPRFNGVYSRDNLPKK